MAISFNLIPNLLFTPGAFIEYDASRAISGLAALPNRLLLIGSKLSTGTEAAETPVQILGRDDGDIFFGLGSQLARMCRALKTANKFVEVFAIALDDDGAGVARVLEVTFANNATSAGIHHFLVEGVRVAVGVAEGDTPTVQAEALEAAINANAALSYTATSAAGVTTLTHKHAGAFGNDSDVRLNYFDRESLDAPGATTVVIAQDTAGAGNPDVADAIAAIGDEWFTRIVSGYSDAVNIAALEAELSDRWGPTVQQDGLVYAAIAGNFGAAAAVGAARNSQFSTLMGANTSPTPPWVWAATVAGVCAAEPDPARPRQTLPLPGVLPAARADTWRMDERNLLLQGGISTHTVGQDGTVSIERLVTTYQTNASGLTDRTYLNVNTMLTLAALRFTTRARITLKYPRHKLADDGTNYGVGQAVVTPSVLRGELIALFAEWEDLAWVEDAEQFADELIVERNATDRDRVDARLGPNLVNQFRVFAGQIQFII